MFDFLKDEKLTENKYKSTSQIPYFTGEDPFAFNDANDTAHEDAYMEEARNELLNNFFAIEEDLEMEDQVSNSDDLTSEPNPDSTDSEQYDSSKGKQSFNF